MINNILRKNLFSYLISIFDIFLSVILSFGYKLFIIFDFIANSYTNSYTLITRELRTVRRERKTFFRKNSYSYLCFAFVFVVVLLYL